MREMLRAHTSGLHAAVDRAFGEISFETRAGYSRFLRAHAHVVIPYEASFRRCRATETLPLAGRRYRSQALIDDLADLGVPATAGGSDPAPPRLDCAASLAGAVYVLEGSRLGGRMIGRRVAKAGADLPTRFLFHGLGFDLWRSLVQWLDAVPWSVGQIDTALREAERAFQAYLLAAGPDAAEGQTQ